MKNNLIIIIALIMLSGCDSYLEEVPDNRQTVKSLKDVSQLLVSSYSEAIYSYVEWKTDNVTAIPENEQFPWMTENYQFKPVVSEEDQDTPTFLWQNNYAAIAHSNQALQGLEEIKGGDISFRNSLRGEALITRAYNHFMLANVFCQHYSEANKGAFGIPYITKPETNLKVDYERGTLESTYNLIEKDLLEALPLISNEYYVGTGKYHFNKNAAIAFASRFYLFKGDYEKCITYSNQLLGNGVINTTYVRDMKVVFTGNASVTIANQFGDVNDPSNFLVVRKASAAVTRFSRGYQANTRTFVEIFQNNIQDSNDQRDSRFGNSSTSATIQPKFTELFQYTTATTGFPYFIMPELRSEEVILSRIESYVRLNRLSDALNDYNVFATKRYDNGGKLSLANIVDFYGGTDQQAMLNLVISERRKEFLREGLRWFDIKRLNLEVTHIDVNGDTFNLKAQDEKKAEQIPVKAIVNGIVANPR
jgi:starch-binding outer membrane protein, SusD/RagB family